MLFGNAVIVALAIAYYSYGIPAYTIPIAMILLITLISSIDQSRQAKFVDFYMTGRNEQLRESIEDSETLRDKVISDFSNNVDLSPTFPAVMSASFIASLYYLVPPVFSMIHGWFESWYFFLEWPATILLVLLFGVLPTISAVGTINAVPAMIEFNPNIFKTSRIEQARLPVTDQHHIDIIRQDADLLSKFRRVETYTLESALLSALSFSSFLSIVLSERKFLEKLPDMFNVNYSCLSTDGSIVSNVMPFHEVCAPKIFSYQYIVENLTSLICLSLLICATMFLGVLVARLRFNEGYRDAESALRAAEKIKDKEEEAMKNDDEDKSVRYGVHLANFFDAAEKLEKELEMNVRFMRLSRDAGILFFIFALVLCGLYFHPIVSIALITIFLFSAVFGIVERTLRRLRSKSVIRGAISRIRERHPRNN